MTSASLLVVLLVGTAVGAFTGGVVGDSMRGIFVAMIAGVLGATMAAIARNVILVRGAGAGPDDLRTPWIVIVYAVVASLATDVTALELARLSGLDSPVLIGTFAGLFASILLAMLMITYHTKPGEMPTLRIQR